MENDEILCEICLENFNLQEKVPKILECCGKIYCMKCLNDIFKKNEKKLPCPICRKVTIKTPQDLKIDSQILEPKSFCPNCRKPTKSKDLMIKIKNDGFSFIFCKICHTNEEAILLKEYLDNLLEEMNYFKNYMTPHDSEAFQNSIKFKVERYVNSIFENTKNELMKNLQEKIYTSYSTETGLEFQNLSEYHEQLKEFKSHHANITNLRSREFKNADFLCINSAINFYIKKIADIQKKSNLIKKSFELINSEEILDEKDFLAKSKLNSLICNLSSIKINNKIVKASDEENLLTGISRIDNQLMLLRQENQKLKYLIKSRELEYESLEKKFKISQKFIEKISNSSKNFKINNYNFEIINSNQYKLFNFNNPATIFNNNQYPYNNTGLSLSSGNNVASATYKKEVSPNINSFYNDLPSYPDLD
jgi:hypothetical protein